MATWRHKIQLGDVFHNEDMSFEERRDAIVCRIKAAHWYDENDFAIYEPVEGLAQAEDVAEFDGWWNEFYDWADANRVWVETIKVSMS